MIDPARTLAARIGIEGGIGEDGLEHMQLRPYPELVNRGVVRISAYALMADMLGGWLADLHAEQDWVFTTDLSIRAPVLRVPELVHGTTTPLRVGRKNVAAEVQMYDETGVLFAYSHVGFVRTPRRPGDHPKPDFEGAAAEWGSRPRITSPLDAEAGIEVVDSAEGHLHVELRDTLLNPAGAMQGAMVALVGEVAAETMATHHLGRPHVVTDLDVRYLAMGRVGPVRSRATFVGAPADATLHVELRDAGVDDRLMTVLLARTAPAPA